MNKKHIKKYVQLLKKRTYYISENLLEEVFGQLKISTPIKTGYLNSRYIIDNDSILNDALYIWYVNNGTKYQQGQHFRQRSIAIGLMQLNKYIKRASKKDV